MSTGIEYYDKAIEIGIQPGGTTWRSLFPYDRFPYDKKIQWQMRYAFAIPSPEAIEAIAAMEPIVEIGAGTGYWAHELKRAGAIVMPFDIAPPNGGPNPENKWPFGPAWTNVLEGSPESLASDLYSPYWADWTLLLCWPYMDAMAFRALRVFQGRRVVYVGEGHGGCTASDKFFDLLNRKWEQRAHDNDPAMAGAV